MAANVRYGSEHPLCCGVLVCDMIVCVRVCTRHSGVAVEAGGQEETIHTEEADSARKGSAMVRGSIVSQPASPASQPASKSTDCVVLLLFDR